MVGLFPLILAVLKRPIKDCQYEGDHPNIGFQGGEGVQGAYFAQVSLVLPPRYSLRLCKLP